MKSETKTDLTVVLFLAALGLIRLFFVQSLPLLPDEANSWQWSRHLAAGYYDNGPLVAFTLRAGTLLLGQTPLGLRLTGLLFGLGASLLLYDLARLLFRDRRLGLGLVLAVNSTLLFGVGGLFATYDLPQIFFWTLALDLAVRLFFIESQNSGNLIWLALGLSLGLSMLAKYSSLLLALGLGGFMIFSPRHRRLLTRKGPYLALAAAFAAFMPNLLWNLANGFAAFGHVLGLSHGNGGGWRFQTPEFLGTQALLVGPILFVILVLGLVRAWKRAAAGDPVQSFLLWTSLPALALFTLMSIWTKVYGNWTGPGYVGAFLAAGGALAGPLRSSVGLRRWALAALVCGYALLGLGYAHRPVLAALDLKPEQNPAAEMYGWPELGPALDGNLAGWTDAREPFIFSTRYQLAGLAAFYAQGRPETVCLFPPGERFNQYIYWSDPAELKGRDGLGVIKLSRGGGTKRLFWAGLDFDLEPVSYYRFQLAGLFQEVDRGEVRDLAGPDGKNINRVVLFRCINFRGVDRRNR